MSYHQVFTEQTANASSVELKVLSGHQSMNPLPSTVPSVLPTNGSIFVVAQNAGANNCKIEVQWSIDKVTWVSGITTHPSVVGSTPTGETLASVKDALLPLAAAGFIDNGVSNFPGNTGFAGAFSVKAPWVRLNITDKGSAINVNAWIGAV